jgi:hypothetical protein
LRCSVWHSCVREISIFDIQFERLTMFNIRYNRLSKFDIEPTNFFNPQDSLHFPYFPFLFLYLVTRTDKFAPSLILSCQTGRTYVSLAARFLLLPFRRRRHCSEPRPALPFLSPSLSRRASTMSYHVPAQSSSSCTVSLCLSTFYQLTLHCR